MSYRRVLCLSLPDLALQVALDARPELHGRPIVVGGMPSEPRPVVACSVEAAHAGVQAGMRLKEAQSYCPEAVFVPEMPAAVRAAMARLADLLSEVSPLVEGAADGLFWIGLDGSRRLWPDESDLAAHVKAVVARYGKLRVRIGIADTKFAALVATLESELLIVPPGQDAHYLSEQPIDRLPTTPETVDALRALGIHSLGAFAALPPNAVVMRFGKAARTLQLLARGFDEARVIAPAHTPPIRTRIAFDGGETVRERLLWIGERRLVNVYRRMAKTGLAARILNLTFCFDGGAALHETLPIEDPLIGLVQLQRLLRWRLEALDLPAPVQELSIELADLHRMDGRQLDLFAARQVGDVRRLLSELVARWGTGRIMQSTVVESRRVEAAFSWAEPALPIEAAETGAPRPRPALRLLPEPRPVTVTLREDRPNMLLLGARRERIVAFGGPWRLEEGWWDAPMERDEYQLSTASAVYYVIYDRIAERWSLLGAFD